MASLSVSNRTLSSHQPRRPLRSLSPSNRSHLFITPRRSGMQRWSSDSQLLIPPPTPPTIDYTTSHAPSPATLSAFAVPPIPLSWDDAHSPAARSLHASSDRATPSLTDLSSQPCSPHSCDELPLVGCDAFTTPSAAQCSPASSILTDCHAIVRSTSATVSAPRSPHSHHLVSFNTNATDCANPPLASVARPSRIPSVSTLEDAFAWPEFLCSAEFGDDISRADRFLDIWSSLTYNELFAGISGHGLGLHEITREVNLRRLACALDPITPPTCTARVDNSEFSIAEMSLLNDNACQFANINMFFVPEIQKHLPFLESHPNKICDSLIPITLSGKAVCDTAWCHTHNNHCTFIPAKLSIASAVCTAESAMNCSRPGRADASSISTIAFCALMRLTRPRCILHECVKGRKGFIMELLGDIYSCNDSEIDVHNFGWPVHKHREWLCLFDKSEAVTISMPFRDFLRSQYRVCTWSWQSFMRTHLSPDDMDWDADSEFAVNALNDELQSELNWATKRLESLRHGTAPPTFGDTDAFRMCLTSMEHRHLYAHVLTRHLRLWPCHTTRPALPFDNSIHPRHL